MKSQNAKRFKEKSNINKTNKSIGTNRFKESPNKKSYIFIIILLIILITIALYYTFFYKNIKSTFDNNSIIDEKTRVLDLENGTKKITNYETLEASNLKIKVDEGQSSVSITIKNTSSEICPKLILSILLVDSKNESVITFDAYTSEIEPNKEQILQMYTKQDISHISDFKIKIKD